MFRRKRKDGTDAADAVDVGLDETDETDEAVDAAEPVPAADEDESGVAEPTGAPGVPGSGPYDAEEAPADDIPRIDLGALRVPLLDGLEVRLDMDEQTGAPAQLVLADGESMLQLGVFAAPRSSGIWDEVRAEISESLQGAGGSSQEIEGPLGTELTATIPTGEPGMFAPARFVGVDRPRWFLRGLLSGPAAVDRAAAARLELVLTGTIVVRGTDAMPIRDPLPLKLPPEAAAAVEEAGEQGTPTLEQLDPGPTITETR